MVFVSFLGPETGPGRHYFPLPAGFRSSCGGFWPAWYAYEPFWVPHWLQFSTFATSTLLLFYTIATFRCLDRRSDFGELFHRFPDFFIWFRARSWGSSASPTGNCACSWRACEEIWRSDGGAFCHASKDLLVGCYDPACALRRRFQIFPQQFMLMHQPYMDSYGWCLIVFSICDPSPLCGMICCCMYDRMRGQRHVFPCPCCWRCVCVCAHVYVTWGEIACPSQWENQGRA